MFERQLVWWRMGVALVLLLFAVGMVRRLPSLDSHGRIST
jgi:hypothetical protein